MTIVRPARPDDAVVAAVLLNLSMGNTAQLLIDDEGGRSPADLLAALFLHRGRFDYRLGTIMELDDAVAGLLVSFPASGLVMLDLLTGFSLLSLMGWRGVVRLRQRTLPLAFMREAERGEYYISNIGVLPEFQRRGCGTQLMAFAEEQARGRGLKRCSLIVDENNFGAVRLYRRLGYEIQNADRLQRDRNKMQKGYHRMVKELM